MRVRVIGAGLAGVEAANVLTRLGHKVELVEMKPEKKSQAHIIDDFAELVCSNSFKAERCDSASGLLKEEMRRLGSLTLEVADRCRVGAGGALAVDRYLFSQEVTRLIKLNPDIRIVNREAENIDDAFPVIIATGPMTDGTLAQNLGKLTGGLLSYYDAAAPVISAGSIDASKVFPADRYGDSQNGDYLNSYFDKTGYEAFREALTNARTASLREFERDEKVFEGCMPIERLAKRGQDAIRFGPMKPVGLKDPRTGRRPWAAVQLRKEDAQARLYNIVGFQTNLKYSEQRRVFGMIPGLENAEYARYGKMHRNSFIDSPKTLNITMNLKSNPNVYLAGTLTGFEGYMEAAASGILAAMFLHQSFTGKKPLIPSKNTMCGALLRYITAQNKNFQPIGANFGLLPEIDCEIGDKKERRKALAERALNDIDNFSAGYGGVI